MAQAQDALEIVEQRERAAVMVWLDGGWGGDALVRRQTRPHDDVDVVIAPEQARLAEETLRRAGSLVAEDERPTRFVRARSPGAKYDFHPVTFDQKGNGIGQLADGADFHSPREGFTGMGQVGDQMIRCLPAEAQVLSHVGHEPDEEDVHDMQQLQEHFQLDLPAPYRQLLNGKDRNY